MSSRFGLGASNVLLVLTTLTAAWHVVHITQVTTFFGIFIPEVSVKALSLTMASLIALIFARSPEPGPNGEDVFDLKFRWHDLVLWAMIATGCGFVVFFNDIFLDYGFWGEVDDLGIVMALLVSIPLLEAVRRKTGIVLPIIILSFVALALFQQYLPGVLHGRGYSLERLLYGTYVSSAGVFGVPLGIAVNIVIVFLVFGALMERAGASQWFMDLALSLTGRAHGGPAKAAVLASGMFGSISGSPSGNSATTGVFTIPMMKKVGYKPTFAAGVEAVASTGGMILPPVMGAIAFLMAEWIGRTYVEVVTAAIIPAILYFLVVFASVHFEARRSGIKPTPTLDIPNFWRTLRGGWYFALPIIALIWFLIIAAYQPGRAALYSCGAVVVASFMSRDRTNWLWPMQILYAIRAAVMRWLVIVLITASVGIMIGALELSGVGINVSRFIVDLGGGNLIVTLILVGIVSLLVGMGLDATPAYVTLATLMAPALVMLGVPDIAAHLYVIYWGLASFFTPPTCIAIFVTAAIARAPIWASGFEAMRIGIAAFIVPLAFALNPALLMEGDALSIIFAASTALVGAVAIASGLRGFALNHMPGYTRVLMVGGGLMLVAPGVMLLLGGLALIVLAVLLSGREQISDDDKALEPARAPDASMEHLTR
ncbi:TRAP transporter permease [Alkalilacustris brevis]|uniref:TRAP transporter permease n=1 Tax=Alkalilacustris brevis TaxID=2026338 RepID=UPI000E0DEEE1|nr:TRAP transporter fused permease subunit [Alkalilacustris brevis]